MKGWVAILLIIGAFLAGCQRNEGRPITRDQAIVVARRAIEDEQHMTELRFITANWTNGKWYVSAVFVERSKDGSALYSPGGSATVLINGDGTIVGYERGK
jgi:hypothetical protein